MKDLLSFGEVMIRLSPPGYQRLEQAASFDVQVGGTELNVAIGAGRLGLEAAYLTRLPENALGRMVRNKIREQGIDTSLIDWSSEERLGLYFVEAGTNPRGGDLIYDRKDSAISKVDAEKIPWDKIFSEVRHYHVTGITAALSPQAGQAVKESIEAAKKAGVTVSFDINYRAKLWSEEEARQCLSPLLPKVDILFSSVGEMKNIFKIQGESIEDAAVSIEEEYGIPVIALMSSKKHSVLRMAWQAVVYSQGVYHEDIPIEVEIADRIGGGDAFAAGFLYAYLKKEGNIQESLRYANATAALKYTNIGDYSWSTLEEVEGLIRGKGGLSMKR